MSMHMPLHMPLHVQTCARSYGDARLLAMPSRIITMPSLHTYSNYACVLAGVPVRARDNTPAYRALRTDRRSHARTCRSCMYLIYG